MCFCGGQRGLGAGVTSRRQRQVDFYVSKASLGHKREFQDSQDYTGKLCLEKETLTK